MDILSVLLGILIGFLIIGVLALVPSCWESLREIQEEQKYYKLLEKEKKEIVDALVEIRPRYEYGEKHLIKEVPEYVNALGTAIKYLEEALDDDGMRKE